MYGLLDRTSSPMLGSNVFSNQSNQIRPQSMNMVGGIDPLRGQSLLGQPMRMPAASPMALQLQQRMQPPRQGLLGRIGGRVRSAAQEVGGLFEGDEGRARATALSRSLLRGPSRTPISFGQSLAEGLSAGNVAAEKEIERKFLLSERKKKLEKEKRKEQEKEEVKRLEAIASDPKADVEERKKALSRLKPLKFAERELFPTLSDAKARYLSDLPEDEANKIIKEMLSSNDKLSKQDLLMFSLMSGNLDPSLIQSLSKDVPFEQIPVVTKEEYNALPAGSQYRSVSNGQVYTKK